jgi:competence protein ComEA
MEIITKGMIMIKLSKILFISILFVFSSLSFAENIKENNIALNSTQALDRIDINIADTKVLSLLKGVGMKKAQAIIKYRDENGKFISVDDLLNVNGIGKKILAQNKSKLTI